MKRILFTLFALSISLTSFSQVDIRDNSYYSSIENAIEIVLETNTNVVEYDVISHTYKYKNGRYSGKEIGFVLLSDKDGYFLDMLILLEQDNGRYRYSKTRLYLERKRKIVDFNINQSRDYYKLIMDDGTYITIELEFMKYGVFNIYRYEDFISDTKKKNDRIYDKNVTF